MPEDAISQIEQAQQRLKMAQALVRQVMARQRARLETNREVIDKVLEHTQPRQYRL